MTTSNGNGYESRLSAIEAILQTIAERQVQFQADLTRLEQAQERVEQAQERTQRQIDATTAIANSNARSIEAWEARIEENRIEAEEERSQLKVAIRELIRANQQNMIEHELFRRRFETIEPPLGGEEGQ